MTTDSDKAQLSPKVPKRKNNRAPIVAEEWSTDEEGDDDDNDDFHAAEYDNDDDDEDNNNNSNNNNNNNNNNNDSYSEVEVSAPRSARRSSSSKHKRKSTSGTKEKSSKSKKKSSKDKKSSSRRKKDKKSSSKHASRASDKEEDAKSLELSSAHSIDDQMELIQDNKEENEIEADDDDVDDDVDVFVEDGAEVPTNEARLQDFVEVEEDYGSDTDDEVKEQEDSASLSGISETKDELVALNDISEEEEMLKQEEQLKQLSETRSRWDHQVALHEIPQQKYDTKPEVSSTDTALVTNKTVPSPIADMSAPIAATATFPTSAATATVPTSAAAATVPTSDTAISDTTKTAPPNIERATSLPDAVEDAEVDDFLSQDDDEDTEDYEEFEDLASAAPSGGNEPPKTTTAANAADTSKRASRLAKIPDPASRMPSSIANNVTNTHAASVVSYTSNLTTIPMLPMPSSQEELQMAWQAMQQERAKLIQQCQLLNATACFQCKTILRSRDELHPCSCFQQGQAERGIMLCAACSEASVPLSTPTPAVTATTHKPSTSTAPEDDEKTASSSSGSVSSFGNETNTLGQILLKGLCQHCNTNLCEHCGYKECNAGCGTKLCPVCDHGGSTIGADELHQWKICQCGQELICPSCHPKCVMCNDILCNAHCKRTFTINETDNTTCILCVSCETYVLETASTSKVGAAGKRNPATIVLIDKQEMLEEKLHIFKSDSSKAELILSNIFISDHVKQALVEAFMAVHAESNGIRDPAPEEGETRNREQQQRSWDLLALHSCRGLVDVILGAALFAIPSLKGLAYHTPPSKDPEYSCVQIICSGLKFNATLGRFQLRARPLEGARKSALEDALSSNQTITDRDVKGCGIFLADGNQEIAESTTSLRSRPSARDEDESSVTDAIKAPRQKSDAANDGEKTDDAEECETLKAPSSKSTPSYPTTVERQLLSPTSQANSEKILAVSSHVFEAVVKEQTKSSEQG